MRTTVEKMVKCLKIRGGVKLLSLNNRMVVLEPSGIGFDFTNIQFTECDCNKTISGYEIVFTDENDQKLRIYTNEETVVDIEEHSDGIFSMECEQVFNISIGNNNVLSVGSIEE